MSAIRRHPLVTFFVLTYVLSWGFLPIKALGFLPAGPLIAALIVIPLTQGLSGMRELGSRMIRWRVGWRWYAVALGLPLSVALIAVALSVALGASWSLAKLPALSSLIVVFAVRLINPIDGALGEEPGWRGFALPGVQDSRSPLLATVILGLLITIWHVPLVFIHQLPPAGLLGTFAVTFVYTWVFNHTGGSVLMTLLTHAAEGTFLSFLVGGFVGAAVAQVLWVYVALWVVVAIGLVVFDWQLWRGAAPAPATVQPAYGGENRVR
jgi:membrane protease YdiL (CAAX protease family)